MSPLFLYGREGAQHGPFSAVQMRALAAAGEILPTDSVWQSGDERRILASRVGNLFPAPAAAAAETVLDARAADSAERVFTAEAAARVAASGVAASGVAGVAPSGLAAFAEQQKTKEQTRSKRIINIKGGTLLSQDGISVSFKKKCSVCGGEDPCRSTAAIRIGTTRISFFCRKCRKARGVELQGIY